MINAISDSWKNKLTTDIHNEIRAYLNPRGLEYGPVYSAGSFVSISSSDNAPGRFNGYQINNTYMLPFSTPLTIDCLVKPNFSYNSAEYVLLSWTSGSKYFKLGYNHTNAKYFVSIYTTSETRVYFGSAYASDAAFKVYTRLSIVLDGSTVSAYLNASETSASFSTSGIGALPILNIGLGNNWYINNVRIFNYLATDDNVTSHYSGIKNAEIIFDFERRHCGRERCNITDYLYSYSIDNPSTLAAASAGISIYNLEGQFNDDLFKTDTSLYPSDTLYPSTTLHPIGYDNTFEPETGGYNGTYDQIFLQRRVGLELEAWNTYTDSDSHESLFIGSIAPGSFSRSVSAGGISIISVTANDGIEDIAHRVIRKNRYFEDYYLTSESSPSSSLFHVIAKLATQREIYNYAKNSGFENATISTAWTVVGGTVSRSSTYSLFGTYSALLNCSKIYQDASFDLSQGGKFNFSTWIYSTSVRSITARIGEYISSVPVGSSLETLYHTGSGWELVSVNHTVLNSQSDTLKISIEPDTTTSIYADGCMLVYGDYKPYYIDNTSNTAEVRGAYDWIGIDADTVTYQHPWSTIDEGDKVWDALNEICDATIARYLYIDRSGVLKYRSNLTTPIGSSLGTVPIKSITQVGSGIQSDVANKVKVAGVYINKKNNIETVWQVEASGLESDNDDGSTFTRVIAPGETFPTDTEAPDGYEAKYGDVYEE